MKNHRTITLISLVAASSLAIACEQKPGKSTTTESKTGTAAKSTGDSAGRAATEGAKAASETQKAASEAAKDTPKEE